MEQIDEERWIGYIQIDSMLLKSVTVCVTVPLSLHVLVVCVRGEVSA